MGKKKSPFGFLWVVVLVGIVGYKFFDSDDSNQQSQSSQSPVKNQGNVRKDNFIKPGAWPPATAANDLGVAADQTATNYYVILDASGSMKGMAGRLTKMDAAKKALVEFAANLPEDANLGLFVFSPARELMPLGANNRPQFLQQMQRIQASGGTPLKASMKNGYESLTSQAQRQGGYGRYVMVIVTDGESSDGNPAGLAREIVEESAIEVQTIGFGVQNHALNVPGVTDYVTANSMETLVAALKNVIEAETESFVDPVEFVN